MAKNFSEMEDSNRSSNLSIHEVIENSRRTFLRNGAAVSLATVLAPLSGCAVLAGPSNKIGFKPIPVGMGDQLVVPEGYTATPFAPWGDPVGIAGRMPAFKMDGSNSADDQAVQLGMHHDGLEYFPLLGSSRGLLAINHEYTDDGLLHVGGFNPMNPEKVRKAQNAHGLSVIEVEMKNGRWNMVRPSPYARRVTLSTPFRVAGPAAGHALMRTSADPQGLTVFRNLEQLRQQQNTMGYLFVGRRELCFLLWCRRQAHSRSAALGCPKVWFLRLGQA